MEKHAEEKNELEYNQLEVAKQILLSEPLEIGVDVMDIAMDQLYEVLHGVPVLGLTVKALKTITSVRDAFFTKKVLTFTQSIHNHESDNEKWEKHRKKLLKNSKLQVKEVETLLICLERHKDYEKSKILGRFYRNYYLEKIDWTGFQILAEVLDDISILDFSELQNLYKKISYKKDDTYNILAMKRLNRCGLADYYNGMLVSKEDTDEMYSAKITEFGKIFCEMAFDEF